MTMKLENVNYIYGIGSGYEKHAIKNITLDIHDGEFLGVVGHTGSGKSTLAKLLNGLEKPTSGDIYYNGQNISSQSFSNKELRRKVGLVFQYPEHQLFEVSVLKDVEFGPKNLGLSQLETELCAYEALKMAGVDEELIDSSPHALSGGQKRRVAIAGVLAMKPDILILDEPTAGLDPCGREEILELLKKLHREKGITIILVSHSMEDIARYAERILVLKEGEMALDGPPQKVFRYERELKVIGLGVPQSASVIHSLQQRGMPARKECITPEEAADAIAGWIQKERGQK